jgi:hypothetical protein
LDEARVISTQQGRGTYVLEGLSIGQAEGLRQAALEGLVRSFLTGTSRLAFTPEAVELEVKRQIELWRRAGSPPSDTE